MLDWFTGGNIPQFWKNYAALFDSEEQAGEHRRYVVFDLETTGSDTKDVILSIAALGIRASAIGIGDFFEIQLSQDTGQNETGRQSKEEKFVEAEALIQFLNFIKDATLVSHNSNLDIEMVNQALKRMELGRLRNNVMDINVLYQRWKDLSENTVTSLDNMCSALKISKSDRHTASGNAYTAALIFLKLKRKLGL